MNYSKILITVDEGPTAEKIARQGFQLCKQLNAEIALLSIVESAILVTNGGITPKEMMDLSKKDAKKNHQMLIDKIFKDHKVWTFIEEGTPYEKILKVAEEWRADLIVLGTHGRTGLSHLLMGSVAEKVIRHSTKPLFIVPTKQ